MKRRNAHNPHSSMTRDQVGVLSFVVGMMFMAILDMGFKALLG